MSSSHDTKPFGAFLMASPNYYHGCVVGSSVRVSAPSLANGLNYYHAKIPWD